MISLDPGLVSQYRVKFTVKLIPARAAYSPVQVWSAPNYCYRCGNIASILAFDEDGKQEPKLFHAVPDEERVIPARTTTPYFL